MDNPVPSMDQGHTFVLVPGFWLGAWAWDEVAEHLRRSGQQVGAVTLPGLEGPSAPRLGITLEDHISAVVRLASELARGGREVVLVGHSGSGEVVYGATDRLAGEARQVVRRAVYVDSGPLPDGAALSPDLAPDVVELPLPSWEDLEANGSSLAGLDAAALAQFRERAVPHPAGPARDALKLETMERRDVPVTLVTTSYRSEDVQAMATEGHPFFAELPYLEVTYVDLPTGHWPMWSRPKDLAAILAEVGQSPGP